MKVHNHWIINFYTSKKKLRNKKTPLLHYQFVLIKFIFFVVIKWHGFYKRKKKLFNCLIKSSSSGIRIDCIIESIGTIVSTEWFFFSSRH